MSAFHSESRLIASRYVAALFALAQEKGQLDAVAADLLRLKNLVEIEPALRRALSNPTITRDSKQAAISALLSKLKTSELTAAFMKTLIVQDRASLVGEMAALFNSRLIAHRGEIEAEIHTAVPVAETQLAQWQKQLSDVSKKTVRLSHQVRPALIGGVIIKVGGKMLDHSIAGKLQRLSLQLQGQQAAS